MPQQISRQVEMARPSVRGRRGRRWLFGVILFTLIVGGQEVLFRTLFPLPDAIGFNRARYQMLDGSRLKAEETVRRGLVYDRLLFESRPDGFSEVHQLNLYGFRGPDFAIDPTPGRRRILVIGDSVVEGQGASESETITANLERLIAQDGRSAEVLNLGVVAATLSHSTNLAKDAIPLLRPTDVVFVINMNDLPVPNFPESLNEPAQAFRRRTTPWWTPRALDLVGRIRQGEPIYRRWFHSPMPFFVAAPNPINPWSGTATPPPNLDPVLYRAMAEGALNPWLYVYLQSIPSMLSYNYSEGASPVLYLLRINRACQEAGARLMLAYVPYHGVTHPRYAPALVSLGMDRTIAERLSTDPIYRNQNVMLAQLCTNFGFPLADASESLIRAEREAGPQFWNFDGHPRPAGYATIARQIHKVWSEAADDRKAPDARSAAR